MDLEKTLALIKPDAVHAGKAEEIKQLVELHGFTIIAEQKLQLTKARAEEFYGEHQGKPFFPRLVNFMTSGPVWAMVLAKPDAIKSWRALMGPTNVFTAREQAPRSLRALYGTDGTQNACHGSDSPASAEREIKFYFPNLVLEPLLDSEDCQQYITERIQPALGAALAELARQKPSAEQFEAITFLADYLLNHNPNKPKVVLPDAWDPSADAAHHMEASSDDEELFAQAEARARAKDTAATDAAAPAPIASADHSPAAAAAAEGPGVVQKSLSSHSARDITGAEAAAPVAAQLPVGTSRQGSAVSAASVAAAVTGAPAQPVLQKVVSGLANVSGVSAAAVSAAIAAGAGAGAIEEEPAADADAAATKVQAAFRGYQARKEVADMRREGPTETAEPVPAVTAQETAAIESGVGSLDTEVKAAEVSADVMPAAATSSQPASAAGSRPASAAQLPAAGSRPSTPPAAQAAADKETPAEESSADVSQQAEREGSDASAAEPEQAVAEAAEPAASIEERVVPQATAEPESEASDPVAIAADQSGAAAAAEDSAVAEQQQPAAAAADDDITPEGSSATADDTTAAAHGNASLQAVESSKDRSMGKGQGEGEGEHQEGEEGKEEYSPEQVAAVTRIQAAGRGMLDRKRVAGMKQGEQADEEPTTAATEEQAFAKANEEQTIAVTQEPATAVAEEQSAAAAETSGDAAANASGEYTPETSQADVGQAPAGEADDECTPEASQADAAAAGGDSGEYTPEASQAAVGEGSEATHTTEETDEQ